MMVLDVAIYYDCPNCGEDWCRPINEDKNPAEELRKFQLYGTEWILYSSEIPSDMIGFINRKISEVSAKIDSCPDCGQLFDSRSRGKLMTYKQWKRYKRMKRILFWRKY